MSRRAEYIFGLIEFGGVWFDLERSCGCCRRGTVVS